MSYMQKNLLDDETLQFQTRRHWIMFSLPAFFTLIGMVLSSQHGLLTLLGYLFLIFSAALWLTAIITYLTSEYGVTNKRVIIKTGFIARQSWETMISKIAAIEVKQSLLGRLLGYGTLVIQSTGSSKDSFQGIAHTLQLRRKVQEQIELNSK